MGQGNDPFSDKPGFHLPGAWFFVRQGHFLKEHPRLQENQLTRIICLSGGVMDRFNGDLRFRLGYLDGKF